MSYKKDCRNQVSKIIKSELKNYRKNSYLLCTLHICFVWATIKNIVWTIRGCITLLLCRIFGVNLTVNFLNRVLKVNLKNNIRLGLGSNTPPNPIDKPDWQLTFHDEFEGNTLDNDKWYWRQSWASPDFPFPMSNLQKYPPIAPREYWDPSAIQVSNGTLKLILDHAPKQFVNITDWENVNYGTWTINHKVGLIQSKYKDSNNTQEEFKQMYGYFEIRCKIPDSKATWPAFWVWGAFNWPPEIDIFEIYPSKSFEAFESIMSSTALFITTFIGSDVAIHKVNNVSSEFHIYACEWDSCFVRFYYDNILVRVVHKDVTKLSEPMKVVINNAVDDINEPNYTNELTTPNYFEVDYVRVYKKS